MILFDDNLFGNIAGDNTGTGTDAGGCTNTILFADNFLYCPRITPTGFIVLTDDPIIFLLPN